MFFWSGILVGLCSGQSVKVARERRPAGRSVKVCQSLLRQTHSSGRVRMCLGRAQSSNCVPRPTGPISLSILCPPAASDRPSPPASRATPPTPGTVPERTCASAARDASALCVSQPRSRHRQSRPYISPPVCRQSRAYRSVTGYYSYSDEHSDTFSPRYQTENCDDL